jgi:hypothetical protein
LLSHHLDERDGKLGIEIVAAILFDQRERLFRGPGFAVGTVGAQCVVHVAHVHQAAGNVRGTRIVHGGVAAAVQHDVVFVGHDGGHFQPDVPAQDDPGSFVGVPLHNASFFVGKGSGFDENVLGNPNLSQVV